MLFIARGFPMNLRMFSGYVLLLLTVPISAPAAPLGGAAVTADGPSGKRPLPTYTVPAPAMLEEGGGAESPVTLRQAEILALQNNLQLKSSQYATQASRALVERGYGVYDPTLNLGFSQARSRNQQATLLDIFTFVFAETRSDGRNYTASLDQKIFTGADLSLNLNHNRSSISPSPSSSLNPEYRTDLSLSLVQPLLKGFGRTYTEQEILFAAKDHEASLQDLRNQAFSLLSDVRKAYFDVLALRDDLRYRQSSLDLAKQVQEENRARVEVGVLPQVELLEAEVGVKTRERDLLDAERAYRDALDQLNLLVNVSPRVRPGEEALEQPELSMDEESGVLAALQLRPELQRRLRELERLQLQATIDNNQLLPNLDLSASYGQKGIDSSATDSLEGALDKNLRDWQVGLNLRFPIGNRAAKSDLLRTNLQIKGQHSDLEQLRSEIRSEVRAAIRLVDVSKNKIEAASQGRELAQEKLQILLARKDVGLATTRDVLQGEEDLALANTDLIGSVADYNKALTDYLRVTGQLLEQEGVRFSEEGESNPAAPAFEMPKS